MIEVFNPNATVLTYKEESSGRTYSIQPYSSAFVPEEALAYFQNAPGVTVMVAGDAKDVVEPNTPSGDPEPDTETDTGEETGAVADEPEPEETDEPDEQDDDTDIELEIGELPEEDELDVE